MKKKVLSYSAPQTCCETLDTELGLCQASAADFETPDIVEDLTWSD